MRSRSRWKHVRKGSGDSSTIREPAPCERVARRASERSCRSSHSWREMTAGSPARPMSLRGRKRLHHGGDRALSTTTFLHVHRVHPRREICHRQPCPHDRAGVSLACLLCHSLLMSANSIFEGVTEVQGACRLDVRARSLMEALTEAMAETAESVARGRPQCGVATSIS